MPARLVMRLGLLASVAILASVAHAICPSRLPPGENELTVQVGSMLRTFYVYVPHDMPDAPTQGVVMIHGCGSSPEKFGTTFSARVSRSLNRLLMCAELESQMNVNAAEKKWFSVYPKGTTTETTPSARLGWNAGSSSCRTGSIPNDVDFMRAVVLYVSRRWAEAPCIHTSPELVCRDPPL